MKTPKINEIKNPTKSPNFIKLKTKNNKNKSNLTN